MKKTLIASALVATLLFPTIARAATTEQLLAQIQQLLKIVAELQIRLAELKKESVISASSDFISGTDGVDVAATDGRIANIARILDDAAADFKRTGSVFDVDTGSLTRGIADVVIFGETITARPGSSITLSGRGISGANRVHFGEVYTLRNQQGNSFGQLTFTVPAGLSGTYRMVISNANGVSNGVTLVVQ